MLNNLSKITYAIVILLGSASASAQTCNSDLPLSAPDTRYLIKGETVVDNWTGLEWARCGVGQSWDGVTCTEEETTGDWQWALQKVEEINLLNSFSGSSAWRLPNTKEFNSVVEHACYGPALNEEIFPSRGAYGYWTGQPSVDPTTLGSSGVSMLMHLYSGSISANLRSTNRYAVWLVRGTNHE